MSDTPESRRSRDESARVVREQTERSDIEWLMSQKQGRRIVWRQLDEAGVFRTTFSESPERMAFNEGFRNAGLSLLNKVMACSPDAYVQMMKESKE